MRLEKSEQLLHLAMMMQGSTEGVGLANIQEEFEVGRRTAERMRDAIFRLFPQIEEIRQDDKTKRWRIPSDLYPACCADRRRSAGDPTAVDMMKKEHIDPCR